MRRDFDKFERRFNMINLLSWLIIVATLIVIILIAIGVIR